MELYHKDSFSGEILPVVIVGKNQRYIFVVFKLYVHLFHKLLMHFLHA